MHVLDPQLKPVRLVQRAKDLLGSQWEEPRDATLSAMTFGRLARVEGVRDALGCMAMLVASTY